jgi:hypothetical protein
MDTFILTLSSSHCGDEDGNKMVQTNGIFLAARYDKLSKILTK